MRKDTKPDTSILVKTGHFYFGLTEDEKIVDNRRGIEYYSSTEMKKQTKSIQAYYYYYTKGRDLPVD